MHADRSFIKFFPFQYWMYKFRNVEANISYTNKTILQAEFTPYLSITSTGPSLFFLILNIIFSHR